MENLNKEIEKEFDEMNRKCDEAYGTGQFPPEVKSFYLAALAKREKEAYEAGKNDGILQEAATPTKEELIHQGRAEAYKEIGEMVEGMKFTQMDIAMNQDLSFLQYTPTEIWNKALSALQSKLKEI